MINTETVEQLIGIAEKKYGTKLLSDNEIISKYFYYQAKYENLVIEGGSTTEYYIKKEAYRRLANKRGYSDEVLRAERNRH